MRYQAINKRVTKAKKKKRIQGRKVWIVRPDEYSLLKRSGKFGPDDTVIINDLED